MAQPSTVGSALQENREEKRKVPEVIKTRSPVRALTFANIFDGKNQYLVSGDKEAVRIWRLRSNREWQQTGWAEAKDVRCIAVSEDGKWIAAGKSWGETTVWEMKTQVVSGSDPSVPTLDKPVFTYNDGHTVTSVDFSPIVKNRLVIASGSRSASIWDIVNNKRLVGPLEHSYWVVAAKFSPDGRYLATATYHRDSVRLYNSNDGAFLAEFTANVTAYYNTGLLWYNDSILLALTKSTIKQFRIPSGRSAKSVPDSEWPVSDSNYPCIALPHPGQFIIHSGCDGVMLFSTGRKPGFQETLFKSSQDVLSMAVTPNGQFLATADWDGRDGVGSITFRSLLRN